MPNSPVHFNGNLLCAIDVETTGLKWGYHDIREIAIIPVAPDCTYDKTQRYFSARFLPKYENIDWEACSRQEISEMKVSGINPDGLLQMLREWFESLKLKPGKKIVPLGCNYANFDRNFIMDWVGGPLQYDEFFRSDSRDVQQMALMINDMSDWHCEKIPFPKTNLQYLAMTLDYKPDGSHRAVSDCLTTIEVYKRLMRYHHYANPMRV